MAYLKHERWNCCSTKKLLPRAHDALDDAIKAAVNGDWSQEDYDEWDAVRRALAATEEPA